MNVSAIKKDVIVAESAIAPLISIIDFLRLMTFFSPLLLSFTDGCRCFCCCCGCLNLSSVGTNQAIIKVTITAAGVIKRNVACHPKFWIILAPISSPTTDPPESA